jgi:acyl-CoA reductase-like NAD-dependent aldehyde dehydrogenase
VAPQRFFVEKSKLAAFEEVVVEETRKLKVGSGFDPEVRVGPMASGRHRDRIEELVGQATAGGATVRTGGRRPPALAKGFFIEPTVLHDVKPEMTAFSEEVFGPLFTMTSFDQLDDAIARANSTSYGLAAYVFTNDLQSAIRAYERLDFGMIGVNEWAPHATEAPFVGRKMSGCGHEAGPEGLHDNLETKLVTIGSIAP